jgi:catalase
MRRTHTAARGADPGAELPTWWVDAAELGRYAYQRHAGDDDFVQPRALYREVMHYADREHLVTNIVAHASAGVSGDVQRRVVGYWTSVDPERGGRIAAGLAHGHGAESPQAHIHAALRAR